MLLIGNGRLVTRDQGKYIENGAVAITIGQRYPLRDAARAHEDLEAGRTTGSTLLMP